MCGRRKAVRSLRENLTTLDGGKWNWAVGAQSMMRKDERGAGPQVDQEGRPWTCPCQQLPSHFFQRVANPRGGEAWSCGH